ncbi:TPA: MFS transporter [Legionella pneumophila]|nr:MFS transporter [Legionella pneumophila]HCJ4316638.1 MFS transporter [Legionella pneumophila]HDZ4927646.1 MFS transporter [Legionella pneumophila]
MENNIKRTFIATTGTFLEWTEFTYYAYISGEIGKLFFSNLDNKLALIATFTVFAIGYLFRPIGALFFGYVGDKYGRRFALRSSIMLMGISSILIGCLPTYQSIGITAPILLLLFRILQGFAVSGEFNGSAVYLIEHEKSKQCLAGSWTGTAAALGMMFGSLLATIIYLPNMPSWSWRVPFLLGFLSCVCAMYFRKNLSETPEYLQAQKDKVINPAYSLFKGYIPELTKAVFLVSALGVFIYIMNLYYATHLRLNSSLSTIETKIVVTFGQALVVLFMLLVAFFADRFDGKQVIRLGLYGMFIAAPLVYFVPYSESFSLILLCQFTYAICNALVGVPIFKLLNDLFPVSVRYSGTSISWNISIAIFAGTAPLVANYLQQLMEYPPIPAFYILLFAGIALYILRTTKSVKLIPQEI